ATTGEKCPIHRRKRLERLGQRDRGFPPVSELDALAEPETASVRAEDVQIAVLSGFDRRGNAAGYGIVLSEVFALFNGDRLDKEDGRHRKDDENNSNQAYIDGSKTSRPSGGPRRAYAHRL